YLIKDTFVTVVEVTEGQKLCLIQDMDCLKILGQWVLSA
ncbi:hypothetical protein HKBW3S06_01351, partial [Candidatus Hakubella thermalkaliphila]